MKEKKRLCNMYKSCDPLNVVRERSIVSNMTILGISPEDCLCIELGIDTDDGEI